jgi:hypothetical protein
MKLSTGIVLLAMTAGTAAWGQNPDVIQNTRDTMKAVGQKAEMDRKAALAASPAAAKPAAGMAATTTPAAASVSTVPSAHPTAAPKTKAPAPKAQAKTSAQPAPQPAEAGASSAAVAPEETEKSVRPEKSADSKGSRRDRFVSPVVQRINGPGCSTGKRCLAIDQIALKGIIRSEAGMIAVVTNALDKAYFLRENDPVFNGYVVKITGDSIVFRESFQDRLGKSSTRDIVKKITTPAV